MPFTTKIRNLRTRVVEIFYRKDEKKDKPLKKRKKTKLLAAGIVVVLVFVIALRLVVGGSNGTVLRQSDITTLTRTDLQNTVSATGMVESASSVLVHSTQSYTVEQVYVKVGDYVEAGQLMAKLDDENIVKQIETQKATMSDADRTGAASIAVAQHNYEQYKSALQAGLNSSILSAESSVSSAYDNYEKAVSKYQNYKADLVDGTDNTIKDAENQVDSAYNSYVSAKNTYERYKTELESGTNSNIMNAESALTTAYNTYTSALKTYERYKTGVDSGKNTTLLNQDSAVKTAENAVKTAEDSYNSAVSSLNNAAIDVTLAESELQNARSRLAAAEAEGKQEISQYQDAVSAAETKLRQAQIAYDNAQSQVTSANRSLENAKQSSESTATQSSATQTSVKETLEDYKTAADKAYESYLTAQTSLKATQTTAQNTLADYATNLENAYKTYESKMTDLEKAKGDSENTLNDYANDIKSAKSSYQSAQDSLKSAQSSAQNQLQSYEDNLNSARAGADSSAHEVRLRQLRADLEGTEISAPMSGVVTAVYAKEGSSGSGLMFVIEDVDNLVVKASVKEYDVGNISSGMAVAIKSDSTGDVVYDGEVIQVAPTANKNAAGDTDTSKDISFATDVKVTSEKTALKIGMNVRLNFVLEEAKDVLTVPYDAVYKTSSGQTCILVVEEQKSGNQLLKEYPISMGLENDLDVVITGDGLKEGMRFVSNPSAYLNFVGQELSIAEGGF